MPIFIDLIPLTSPFYFEQSLLRWPASILIFFFWMICVHWSVELVICFNQRHLLSIWRARLDYNTLRDLWTLTTAREEATNHIRWGSDPVSLKLERPAVTRGDEVVMGNKKETVIKKDLLWCGFVNIAFKEDDFRNLTFETVSRVS